MLPRAAWHNGGVRSVLSLVVAAWSALLLSGCAHPQARTEPDLPALGIPPVPERVIAPVVPDEPPPPAVDEPEAESRKTVRPKAGAVKNEPPKSDVAAKPPAVPPLPGQTAGTLQTTPPASQAELVKTIRGLIAQAQRDLLRVNRAALNADGKSQYDTARGFIAQAEAALQQQNLVFAHTLADKAATLAAGLVGR